MILLLSPKTTEYLILICCILVFFGGVRVGEAVDLYCMQVYFYVN